MLTYKMKLLILIKMVQLSPLTDERMRRNKEEREGKKAPLLHLIICGKHFIFLAVLHQSKVGAALN